MTKTNMTNIYYFVNTCIIGLCDFALMIVRTIKVAVVVGRNEMLAEMGRVCTVNTTVT